MGIQRLVLDKEGARLSRSVCICGDEEGEMRWRYLGEGPVDRERGDRVLELGSPGTVVRVYWRSGRGLNGGGHYHCGNGEEGEMTWKYLDEGLDGERVQ